MQNYKSIIKKNILPYLGNIAVQNLTPAILNKWMRELQKSGYSKGRLARIHALDYAIYPAEFIFSTPAIYVSKKASTDIIKCHIITLENILLAVIITYRF